ncbi:retrovirus-related pol polyprotein from transposon TNT 1-94 [Tanacetum coccineum]
MGMVDNTLFTKKKSPNLIIVQIYVDDIIFGSTCQDMCDEFPKIMHDEFEMNMMGELNFFLVLQIKQMEDGIFFNQSKYIKEMLKKFGLEDSKPMKIPMSSDTKLMKGKVCESVDSTKYRGMIGSTHLGLWYPKGTGIEIVVYVDSDRAGDYVDRKSTSDICTFVGCCLTSWFSKKQTALAISTTKSEYVSAGKACQQALWMKQALIDYDVKMPPITLLDHQKTRNYIPLISSEFNQPLRNTTANLEKRYFHEGRVVSQNFQNMSHIRAKFESIDFDCLLNLNEQIVPRFVLEFYSQLTFDYNSTGHFVVNIVIKSKSFSLTLEEFGQILKIPFKGQASHTDMWSLDYLSISVSSKGGHKDHVSAYLCHMLYCIETSTRYNLAFFVLKRMEKNRSIPKELLPYGMLLNRLFKHVMSVFPELAIDLYISHDRVMHPLAPHYERKTRSDRVKKRPRESNASSSSTTLNHPSSSHHVGIKRLHDDL